MANLELNFLKLKFYILLNCIELDFSKIEFHAETQFFKRGNLTK